MSSVRNHLVRETVRNYLQTFCLSPSIRRVPSTIMNTDLSNLDRPRQSGMFRTAPHFGHFGNPLCLKAPPQEQGMSSFSTKLICWSVQAVCGYPPNNDSSFLCSSLFQVDMETTVESRGQTKTISSPSPALYIWTLMRFRQVPHSTSAAVTLAFASLGCLLFACRNWATNGLSLRFLPPT